MDHQFPQTSEQAKVGSLVRLVVCMIWVEPVLFRAGAYNLALES